MPRVLSPCILLIFSITDDDGCAVRMEVKNMVALIVIAVIAVLIVVWGIGQYNRVIRTKNGVTNAWSQIDVQLKRRKDLIPQLVETVKGYARHESATLEEVTRMRTAATKANEAASNAIGSNSAEAEDAAEKAMRNLTLAVNAVTEAYPDLKANENFAKLQEELAHTENQVAFARQAYNDQVMDLNTMVESFPSSLFASMAGVKQASSFTISDEDREAPKVSFEGME